MLKLKSYIINLKGVTMLSKSKYYFMVALLCLLVQMGSSKAHAQTNLVSNGGFEQQYGVGWNFESSSAWETGQGCNGQSLACGLLYPTGSQDAVMSQILYISPNATLQSLIDFNLKVQNAQPGDKLLVQLQTLSGAVMDEQQIFTSTTYPCTDLSPASIANTISKYRGQYVKLVFTGKTSGYSGLQYRIDKVRVY